MKPIYKYLLVFGVTGFTLGFILTYFCIDNTYSSSEKVQKLTLEFAKKDTLVQIYQASIKKIDEDLVKTQKDRDFYKGKTDTLLKYSIELANPKVTKRDKTDMILWIQEQNSFVE